MLRAPDRPRFEPAGQDAEALIEEARRRQRRRWVTAFVALMALGTVLAVILWPAGHPPTPVVKPPRSSTPTTVKMPTVTPTALAPLHPYGLAVSPTGLLYLVDVGRDRVLRYEANGTFSVVAGTGRVGFRGDGGPATEAELRLTWQSRLAFAKDGTLYIADSGNDRVRAVSPAGTITTMLGDGEAARSLSTGPATEVSVGPVSGLTVGSDGSLYVAAQFGVAELTADHTVQWAAGSANPTDVPTCGVYCNPASEADFANPAQLAFDSAGDLFVSGGGGSFGVYEKASNGSLRYLGTFRGDGAPAALAEAPNGSVVMSYRGGIVELSGAGSTVPLTSLSDVLGPGSGGHPNLFVGGDGLAIGSDGAVYVDTNTGNSFTTVSAIITVSPTGTSPRVLWKS